MVRLSLARVGPQLGRSWKDAGRLFAPEGRATPDLVDQPFTLAKAQNDQRQQHEIKQRQRYPGQWDQGVWLL
jgi:hypothetical protein